MPIVAAGDFDPRRTETKVGLYHTISEWGVLEVDSSEIPDSATNQYGKPGLTRNDHVFVIRAKGNSRASWLAGPQM